MNPHTSYEHLSDFRRKATLSIAVIALFILTPFSVNNFANGRFLLGAGSLGIVAILGLNGLSILRGRFYPVLTQILVVSIIVFLVFSLRQQGIIGALWCYPALISMYFMLPERQAWLANGALLAATVPQAFAVLETPLVLRMVGTLVAVSAFSATFIRAITRHQDRVHQLAETDPLTGVRNRMLLPILLERAIELNLRERIPMTLLALDLDHFKRINDTYGHDGGDRVLRRVGEFLCKRIRGADCVFRVGGEEFVVLLHGTDADGGYRVAEELRCAISALPLVEDHPVTVSVGVAPVEPDDNWSDWMKRADERLYRAKRKGRDRVVM